MSKKGYRQLGVVHAAKLGKWLEDNAEFVKDATAQEIADRAKVELKMDHLTSVMVLGLVNGLGIEIRKRPRHPGVRSGATDRVHIVAVALGLLFEEMGKPVPPLLQAVIRRQSAKEV